MANTSNNSTTKRFPGDFGTEGRLTKDPVEKQTRNGDPFTVFDIAANVGFGENQETTFFSCSVFGSLAKLASKAKKGSFVRICGELSIEKYVKDDGSQGVSYKIRVDSFRFLNTGNGEKKQGQQNGQQYPQNGNGYYQPQPQAQQYQQPQYAPQSRQPQQAPQQRQQTPQPVQAQVQPQQYQGYPENYEEMPAGDGDLPF